MRENHENDDIYAINIFLTFSSQNILHTYLKYDEKYLQLSSINMH